jgi:hypothetical protein
VQQTSTRLGYNWDHFLHREANVRKNATLLVAFLLSSLTPQAFADLTAIHASALPQETAVLSALDDARQLEPYCHSWTNDWKYPLSKEDVTTRLGKDLGFLTFALKAHPDNAELLLLTGLVARYAYNLDVPGSYDSAINSLAHAQKLAPSDVRAPWFRATLQCQTTEPKAGGDEFLSLEDGHVWDQLPASFWDDYMECASVTHMPAHVLRAADHLAHLHAPSSNMRAFLSDTAQKRFDPFDAKKEYDPKEVWQGESTGADPEFTSTTCGLRFRAHGNWAINQLSVTKGSCVAYLSTGPYKATVHDLRPSLLILVKQPEEKETLEDFSKKFTKKGTFEPFPSSRCPGSICTSMKGVQPGMYGRDGDGHGRIVVFERNQPDFPVLLFESPSGPPKPDASGGLKYYRPNQTKQRIPGKLYYLVLLDVAASIEEPALKDYEFFLQNLTVE